MATCVETQYVGNLVKTMIFRLEALALHVDALAQQLHMVLQCLQLDARCLSDVRGNLRPSGTAPLGDITISQLR